MTNVVLPFDGDAEALRRKLAAWGFEVGERPHAPVYAKGHGVTIHAYATGKLLLNGPRAAEWARELAGEVAPPKNATKTAAPIERGWVVHFDGACLPVNPGGVAAYGFQVAKDGAIVHEGRGLAAPPGPGATNNVAEFRGLIEGLRYVHEHASEGEPIVVRGDSRLAINTVSGVWKVHVAHLKPLHAEAVRLARDTRARLEWVPREKNAEADRLSEEAAADAIRAHPEWGITAKFPKRDG